MKVWVLDMEGYDVRGGNASVFATVEGAKASVGRDVAWVPTGRGWEEDDDSDMGRDVYVIYEREVGP